MKLNVNPTKGEVMEVTIEVTKQDVKILRLFNTKENKFRHASTVERKVLKAFEDNQPPPKEK